MGAAVSVGLAKATSAASSEELTQALQSLPADQQKRLAELLAACSHEGQSPAQEQAPSLAFVLDCGSGHTAIFRYKMESGSLDQEYRRFKAADGKGLKIEDLLSAGLQAMSNFLKDEVWGEIGVDMQPGTPLLFGCTAGMRRALEIGRVSQAALDEFSEAVRSHWPQRRVEVRVITGHEEAEMELVAARCLGNDNQCGLLSGGGSSCQLAFGDGAARQVISVPVGTVEAKEIFERDGIEAGWAWWQQRLAKVKDEVPNLPEGGLRGTFACTAMQCTCAKQAGLATQTVLSRDEVLAGLAPLVEAFKASEEDNERMDALRANARANNMYGKWTDENAAEKWTYFKLIWMPASSRLQAMLQELFSPEACFIFFNEVETVSGQKMKVEWTLGYFLTLIKHPSAAPAA